MKKLLILFAFLFSLCISISSFAQSKNYIESEYFNEAIGWTKLKMLSNGNTAKIDVTEAEGINITLYDSNGKTINSNSLPLVKLTKKLKHVLGQGVFEINKELVLFFVDFPKDVPTLYRIRIDTKNANLIQEEIAIELPKLSYYRISEVKNTDFEYKGFLVQKDVESDYYCILTCDRDNKDVDNRIEVIHYTPEHTELNRAYYTSPYDEFKYFDFRNVIVHSSEYILLMGYALTSDNFKDRPSSYLGFSKLENGKKVFDHINHDRSKELYTASCNYVFDRNEQILHILIMTLVEKNTYSAYIQSYSLKEGKFLNSFPVPFDKLVDDYYEKVTNAKEFKAMPQNFTIDQNGNMTILLQKTVVTNSKDGYTYTNYGDIGLANFTNKGNENYGVLLPYSNRLTGDRSDFYYYNIQKGIKAKVFRKMAGVPMPYLYHIDMISGKEYNYILYNSPLRNFENDLYGTNSSFGISLSSSHAVVYKIDKSGKVSKDFLFGKPDNPIENKFCFFYSSDYDKNTNRFAVIKLEKINKVKQSSVIWMTLD